MKKNPFFSTFGHSVNRLFNREVTMKKYGGLALLPIVMAMLFALLSVQPAAASATLDETPFDYEQAALNHTARWQAMAQFYADHDMLNERFDYEETAVNLGARWQAMAQFYADHDMLNASASSQAAGIVYAMDPVDLKLFNTAEKRVTYSLATVDTADRKFFYSNYVNWNGNDKLAHVDSASR